MENQELACFQSVEGLDMRLLTLKYVTIEINGEPLRVRVQTYNDDPSKKTLVMTHGFLSASVFFARLLPTIGKHYRIVMFDNLGFGLNDRTDNVGDGCENPEKAEKWIVEWLEKVVEACELPRKFYFSGHSAGGAMVMLYASYHPERIEGLFLQSPAAAEDETSENFKYDPYTLRNEDHADVLPSRKTVDETLAAYRDKVHIMTKLAKVPFWLRRRLVGGNMRKNTLKPEVFTPGYVEAAIRYWSLMNERLGRQDVVLMVWTYFLGHLHNSLFTRERMLQDFDFPIAFCNGTRDFFGSADGSNTIV